MLKPPSEPKRRLLYYFISRIVLRDAARSGLVAPKISARMQTLELMVAMSLAIIPAWANAKEIVRELHYAVDVDAQQDWKKSDPKTGEEWSKATTKQHYEVTTRLKTDGRLEVRNWEDLNLDARLEAKTIFLARRAKREMDALGRPFKVPKTEADKDALSKQMQEDVAKCKVDAVCAYETNLRYAELFAAMEYPEALEEDTEPGTFYYFLPYNGCVDKSRVTLELQIDGVRFNHDVGRLDPFSERHTADSINESDGLPLCAHFGASIDTQDKIHPMYLDNVFIPRPIGTTAFTENGHTSVKQEPQPVPTAVVEWMAATLRRNDTSGSASTTLQLPLSLNGNSTWLGLWTGTAKVTFQWSFSEVPTTAAK